MRARATRWVWPLVVGGAFAAYLGVANAGWGAPGFFAASTLVFVSLFVLEGLLPARRQDPALRDPQVWNDVGHILVGQGASTWLGESLLLFVAAALAGRLGESAGAGLWPSSWPLAFQALLLVAVADGLECLRHRLLHTVSWLWPLHALHHDADRLHIFKSGRTHLLDMLMRYAVVFAPLVLLGVPADVLFWYPAAVTVFGPVAHANLEVRLPGWLHRVFMTPQVHRLHHARDLSLSLSNYCNVFPFWDRLFGTFQHPDDHGEPEYGVEQELPRSFAAQLALPFTWRRVVSRPTPSPPAALAAPFRTRGEPARPAPWGSSG